MVFLQATFTVVVVVVVVVVFVTATVTAAVGRFKIGILACDLAHVGARRFLDSLNWQTALALVLTTSDTGKRTQSLIQ